MCDVQIQRIGVFKFLRDSCAIVHNRTNLLHENFDRWREKKLDSTCLKRIPYFIVLVSLVEVALYYLANDTVKRYLLYDPEKNTEIWRFLTYMLIHKDYVHLFLNLIIQAFLGLPLEAEQGGCRCMTIYFSGGLAGSMGAAIFSPPTLMAGASGGIYSLLTSHVANIILNYETMSYVWYRITAVTTLMVADFIHITYHVWLCNNENPKIEWVAHASGALSGLLIGLLVFSSSSKWRRKIQVTSCLVLIVVVAIAAAYHLHDVTAPVVG
ncbi:hypothetical protein RUM43_005472 [Polyplax serrata]|uniref:Peptidase S54 rhomboid domain-containing protein n=1 Tax=Polyplax serrata TaxID=468196 RepID=A0AAN8RUP8_POLSC